MNHLLWKNRYFLRLFYTQFHNVSNDSITSEFASAIMLNIRKNSNGMIESELIKRFHKEILIKFTSLVTRFTRTSCNFHSSFVYNWSQ